MASSSSASRDMAYDVFLSFRGEDVRKTFLSHFMSKLDQKLIFAFKDYEIESSRSLGPELRQAIRNSRIALVIFSGNYASSSWCLDELLEIVNCKEEFGQMVIPLFYDLDPTHVRKQTGNFGEVFERTCETRTEEEIQLWRRALTDVANLIGYHSAHWRNEAEMIEKIANDVLEKLLVTPSSQDSHNFVGIEDHIAEMSKLLELESDKVIVAGIWGSSGIGKTTIARTLFNQLSRHFQGSIFIDRGFVAKSMQKYCGANPDDYNMKLDLQRNFLSEILQRKDIQVDHLGVVGEKLQYHKVLIVIDDLYDKVVLDALAGQTLHFGSGSRIVVVTNDKDLLMARGIDHIYEVGLPSIECALKMFCQYAFNRDNPPDGLVGFAKEVVRLAGSLPLGLNIMGSSMRGKNKEECLNMLPRLRRSLNGKIEETLMFSYAGLDSEEDKTIFRHIACSSNHMEAEHIKLLLADSELDVDVGLSNLTNKSLIRVREGRVEMHNLLQKMGRNIVLRQSIDMPGKREFLWRPEDIREVFEENTGTKKVLGISLKTNDIDDELHIHKNTFKRMPNLRFLEIYSNNIWEEDTKLCLPEGLDHLSRKIKLLSWSRYPLRCLPSNFCPKRLVKLIMRGSKLEKLWDGVSPLTCLVEMDLSYSPNLKEIPDLSMATNLEKLDLSGCESLVELPSSIKNLNKLIKLKVRSCYKLETLPNGINLKSLDILDLVDCRKLRTFPEISTNISDLRLSRIEEFPSNLCLENLESLRMHNGNGDELRKVMQLTPLWIMLVGSSLRYLLIDSIPDLVEFPSSFLQTLNSLKELCFINCINLDTLPTGINLQSLYSLDLSGCSRLTTFPDISTNITFLYLSRTAIKEVPWWIEKFSRLEILEMTSCSMLEYINFNISKLKRLHNADFGYCEALNRADLSGVDIMEAGDCITAVLGQPLKVHLDFTSCFSFDRVLLPPQHSFRILFMILPGEEVPSYFTHCTAGSSTFTNIPLLHTSLSQPRFAFRMCAAVFVSEKCHEDKYLDTKFEFKGRSRKCFRFREMTDSSTKYEEEAKAPSWYLNERGSHLCIWDCHIPLNEKEAQLYTHMDIHLRVIANSLKLKSWGIRTLEDCSLAEIRLGSSNTPPHVSRPAREEDMVTETEQGEDCGDNDNTVFCNEADKSEKCESSANRDINSEDFSGEDNMVNDDDRHYYPIEQGEECGESDDGSDTDQSDECESSSGDSDSDTHRSCKRKRLI